MFDLADKFETGIRRKSNYKIDHLGRENRASGSNCGQFNNHLHIYETMIRRKRITKDELAKLDSLFSNRRTGADQQQRLNEFWKLLVEKYRFHSDHTIIHNETGEIFDNCYHHKSLRTKNIANADKN